MSTGEPLASTVNLKAYRTTLSADFFFATMYKTCELCIWDYFPYAKKIYPNVLTPVVSRVEWEWSGVDWGGGGF